MKLEDNGEMQEEKEKGKGKKATAASLKTGINAILSIKKWET